MSQKLEAESLILMSIFYNSGDVGDSHEVIINELDMSNRRLECGELVVGNFGHCSCGCGKKSRFAYIGKANKADIC